MEASISAPARPRPSQLPCARRGSTSAGDPEPTICAAPEICPRRRVGIGKDGGQRIAAASFVAVEDKETLKQKAALAPLNLQASCGYRPGDLLDLVHAGSLAKRETRLHFRKGKRSRASSGTSPLHGRFCQ